jgi:hypothetical protein
LCTWAWAAAQAQTILFEDSFNGGASFGPAWTPRPNLTGTNGVVDINVNGGYARLGKSVDGGFTTNALDLRLNLAGRSHVELSFDIFSNGEETHPQDGLYFSNNGGQSFVKVYDFRPEDWCQFIWGQFPPLPVHQLAAANGLALTANFVVRFQQHDNDDFGLFPQQDGFFITNVSVRSAPPVYANLPFSDGFGNASLGASWKWSLPGTTTGQPALTSPMGEVGVNVNQGHAFLGRRCDGGANFTTNALDLHLNLAGQSHVELSFDIFSNGEETHPQDGLYFSNNGGSTFVKVYDFRPEEWCQNVRGRFPPLPVHQLAAANGLSLTANFVVRFQQHDNDDFGLFPQQDGFFITNVSVRSAPPVYANLPFSDGFGNASLGASWKWSLPGTTTGQPALTSPMGEVGVNVNRGHAFLGRRCDGGNNFTTNALDLHLNLAGQSHVELSFDIYSNGEETHPQDGLYFSDNGGTSFVKVYDFRPEEWCHRVWGSLPPLPVHQLAAANGLRLTANFVVRFQQHDNDALGSFPFDGLLLDNVSVRSAPPVYASLPFSDNFGTSSLGSSWKWALPGNTTGQPVLTSPMGMVGVDVVNGGFAFMGRRCDGGNNFTTNALDLHLNLASNPSTVTLAFRIQDRADENHPQDGIYLSNNGGQTFVKVHDFLPESWADFQWQNYPPLNLAQLAAANGLGLTANFVVRFQQHDNEHLRTCLKIVFDSFRSG